MAITSNQLATIGIRLLAVYVAVQGIVGLPETLDLNFPWSEVAEHVPYFSLLILAGLLIPLLFGLLLWAVAGPLGRLVVGSPGKEVTESAVNLDEMQAVALSTAGLLIIIFQLPMLVSQVNALYQMSVTMPEDVRQDIVMGLVPMIVNVLLGLLLVTTSNFWVRLLERIRNFGLEARS